VKDCPNTNIGFHFDGATFTHVDSKVTFELLLANFNLEQDVGLTRLGTLVSCSHLQYSARRATVNGPDPGLACGPKFCGPADDSSSIFSLRASVAPALGETSGRDPADSPAATRTFRDACCCSVQGSTPMREQPLPIAASPVPWLLRRTSRLFASALAGGAAALTTTALPPETRAIISLDVFLFSFVALTVVLTSVATAEHCALMARQKARIKNTGLIALMVASLVGIGAIAVMLHSQKENAGWLRMLHLGGSQLALLLGWAAAQMIFGIQYMRIYYNNLKTTGSVRSDPDLDFPGQSEPDLWDFMYYSFTIAMCFQTSDVSIRGTAIRRLTLVQAIFSFFFVAAIIGFAVNVLFNLA